METRLFERASRRTAARRYAIAILAPLLALLVRLPLQPILTDKVPYITFFLATAISAIYGGLLPGVLSTALGALLALLWVLPPISVTTFAGIGDGLGFVLFLSIGGLISYLAGTVSAARIREHTQRQLFQQTLLSLGDAVIATDDEQRVRIMNPVAEELTGWKEAEARGKPIKDVFHIVREGTDEPAEIPIARILATGMVIGLANHTELIARNGTRIAIDDSGAPIRDERGEVAGAVLVFRDVSEKRKIEQALARAEQKARRILDSISDAFILIDHEWRYLQVNHAAEQIMGGPAATFLGKSYWDTWPSTVGTPLEKHYREAVATGIPVHFEHYFAPWDRWYEIRGYPSAEGLAVYFHDITDRKASDAALRRLNDDLQQFTFAATHDMREPLRMMTIAMQRLKRNHAGTLGEQATELLQQATNGAQRMSRLIDGLLAFSRVGEINAHAAVPVPAQAALGDATTALQAVIAETQAVITHDTMPTVLCDPTHLSQIFQNLLGNAMKYRSPDAPPRIHVAATRDGTHWVLAVRDNGIGIAQQDQERIFLPFERLHGPEITGAGIGLATCKRIAERYGGNIWVDSTPKSGSTFFFSLPAQEDHHAR